MSSPYLRSPGEQVAVSGVEHGGRWAKDDPDSESAVSGMCTALSLSAPNLKASNGCESSMILSCRSDSPPHSLLGKVIIAMFHIFRGVDLHNASITR